MIFAFCSSAYCISGTVLSENPMTVDGQGVVISAWRRYSLALVIAAATAIFSVVDALMLT